MRSHNRKQCKQARDIRSHHDEEKPEVEGNQAALKHTLAELSVEERNLREAASSAERKKEAV